MKPVSEFFLRDFRVGCEVDIESHNAKRPALESDAELVGRIKQGDREALGTLCGRYLPSVWRYVHAQLPRDAEGQKDVVSETFLAAIRGVLSFDESAGSVSAWLIGIARHKLVDAHRRARSGVAMDGRDAGAGELVASDSADDPPVVLLRSETRAAVGRVMGEMDDDDRLVLEWKYLEGISVREMADRLGKTEKSVEARLFRARKVFRDRWGGLDG